MSGAGLCDQLIQSSWIHQLSFSKSSPNSFYIDDVSAEDVWTARVMQVGNQYKILSQNSVKKLSPSTRKGCGWYITQDDCFLIDSEHSRHARASSTAVL